MDLWVYEGKHFNDYREATDAEVLAYVAALPGVQVFDTPRPTSGPWLKPGRYLIAPLPVEEDTNE